MLRDSASERAVERPASCRASGWWTTTRTLLTTALTLSCGDPTAPDGGGSGGGGGGGGGGVTPVPTVATVAVEPATDTIAVGGARQLAARLRDASGGAITGLTATWSSSDTAIATVSAGMVTGKREGLATVTANAGGKSGSASILVRIPAARVVVSPADPKLILGATQQFTATVQDSAGTVLAQRAVTWTSSDTTIARIDSVTGRLTARARGIVTVTARHAAVSGTATVTVAPPIASVQIIPNPFSVAIGGTRQLTAIALTADGDTVVGQLVRWTSANSTISSVGDSSGVVTGVALGSTTIYAHIAGAQGTATVAVGRSVDSVVVAPTPFEVGVGVTRKLTAAPRDANRTPLTNRLVTWRSSDTTIARVDTTGAVSGIAVGSTTVVATSEGKSTAVPVSVMTAVTSLRIVPDSFVLGLNSSRQLSVVALAADGDTVVGRTPSWSSNSSGAKVGSDGTVTGYAHTTATITATVDGISATAHATISEAVASVTLPARLTVPIGTSATPEVVLHGANGSVLTGREVTWRSLDSTKVTVDAGGVVRGGALGMANVLATSEGKSSNYMLVEVVPTPVASVTVTPSPAILRRYEQLQLQAVLKDADGNALTGRAITWASSRPGYVTVDTTGLLKGVYPDTATIFAYAGNVRASVPVRVDPSTPVATVAITPSPASVKLYELLQLTATLKDAAGNTLPARPLAWASSNPNIATVDHGGWVTPKAQGTVTISAGGTPADGKVGSVALTVAAPTPIASITMDPASLRLIRGTETGFQVTLRDAAGNELIGRPITWTSSHPQIVSVSSGGNVRGIAVGRATITASSGGRSATATVDVVLPAPVATVRVTPESGTFEVGATAQFHAVPLDSVGTQLVNRSITWSSSNTARATVTATGQVTMLSAGTVTINATSEGKTGGATLTITPAAVAGITIAPDPVTVGVQDSVVLTATVKDARGVVLTGRAVTWSLDAPSIAVFTRPGVLYGLALGNGNITVTSEGMSKTVPFAVTPPVVGRVTIDPQPVVTFVGLGVPTDVRVFATTGQQLSDRTVTYRTGNTSVATVTAAGEVRGVAAGATSLVATSEGKSDTTEIFVESAEVDTILIRPEHPTIMLNGQQQFTAELYNANGSLLPPLPVEWESYAPHAAYPMNTSGLFYGREAAKVGIFARYTRKDGTKAVGYTTLTIEAAPVHVSEVLVQPNPINLNVGQSASLQVIPLDANRQVIYGLSGVTFRSDNTSVATVTTGGSVVARGAGSTKVWATIKGTSGYTVVNVTGTGSGGGGGGGGDTGGGDGGGGGSGGSTCNSTVSIGTPAPGQTSAWVRLPYPSKLEVRIRSSMTNHGSSSAPKYEYFFSFRNSYTDRLYFSYGATTTGTQTSTTYAVSVDAGAIESEPSIYGPPGTLSLYVSGARLGAFSAPTFCE